MGKTGAKGQREMNSFHAEDAEFAEEIHQAKTLRSLRVWREIIQCLRTMAPGRFQNLVHSVNPVQKNFRFAGPAIGFWAPALKRGPMNARLRFCFRSIFAKKRVPAP
jgi:hypothetical protein